MLLSLTQERFKKFLLVVPELRDKIESMIRQRTATNLRSIAIFSKIEEVRVLRRRRPRPSSPAPAQDKRDLLGELLEFRMYRAGSMLMREGAPAEGMDILIQGEVRSLPCSHDIFHRFCNSPPPWPLCGCPPPPSRRWRCSRSRAVAVMLCWARCARRL